MNNEQLLQRLVRRLMPLAPASPTAARLLKQAERSLELLHRRPDLYHLRRAVVRSQPEPRNRGENHDTRPDCR